MQLINRPQSKLDLPFRYYGNSESIRARGLYKDNSVAQQIKAYTHWVYVCVQIRAEAHAKAKFRAYVNREKNSDKKDYLPNDHPAQYILDYPNPYFSRYFFQYLKSIHLDLTGNFYAYIARDRMNVPRQLYPLPPQNVKIVPGDTPDNLIKEYQLITPGGDTYTFTFDDILHIKMPAPGQFIEGYSPTQAAALLIDVFNSQIEWQKNFYDKDATPDLVLETDKAIEKSNKESFISHWMEFYGGTRRQRRMAILDNGLKAKALSTSPKDLQYAETQKELMHQIFGHYRVPLSKAGINESTHTRATAEAYNYTFYSDVVDPRLMMVEEQLQVDLMNVYWPHEKFPIRVTHGIVIPDDEERRANIDKIYVETGVNSRNEIRGRKGELPISGGDSLLVQNNLVPIEATGNPLQEPKQ